MTHCYQYYLYKDDTHHVRAVLLVPCQFLGIDAGWHFILGDPGFVIKIIN